MATTYYVSTTGSNGNAGTIGSPKRTLQAMWNACANTDTILMRGGTYTESAGGATLDLANQGRDSVTVMNYDGEDVICEVASGNTNVWFLKNVSNCSFKKNTTGSFTIQHTGAHGAEVNDFTTSGIRIALRSGESNPSISGTVIDGLVIKDIFGNGILTGYTGAGFSATAGLTIQNCEISGCATGIRDKNGDGNIIQDNYIHDQNTMHQNDVTAGNDGGANGVAVDGSTGTIIRRNVISGNHADSIDYGTDGGAVEIGNSIDTCAIVVGGVGNGASWTKWGYTGFGDGNVCFNNHGFLETGTSSPTGLSNGGMEVSYNIVMGRNDYQSGAASTPFMLLRAFINGHVHHNVFDVDDGSSGGSGLRWDQSGSYVGEITGITVEDNVFRTRFTTPVYNFGTLAIPSGTVVRNNAVYYASDYTSNVIVRSGTDYTLADLAAAQSSTSTFAAELWGDSNTNEPASNPDFVDCTNATLTSRDYSTVVGSPLIDAGHDGTDIGAYQRPADPPAPSGVRALGRRNVIR